MSRSSDGPNGVCIAHDSEVEPTISRKSLSSLMVSSSRSKQSSSSSKPPKMNSLLPPPPPPCNLNLNRNRNQNQNTKSTASDKGKTLIPPPVSHLSREQVLRRRSDNLKELANSYKDNLWTLMEDVRVQFRDFTWKFGESPFEEDNKCNDNKESRDNVGDGENGFVLCGFNGCKFKAMALTRFCNLHILSDPRQQLYKPCDYVIKSSAAGDITCGKPISRAIIPAHCNTHKHKAQYHLNRALRKAGLNVSPSDTVAPKLNVLVAEFVREIQIKRKAIVKAKQKKVIVNN